METFNQPRQRRDERVRMKKEDKTYRCEICNKPVPDFVPAYCCDGRECGCHGQPLEPCVCSQACYDALIKGIGKEYEQRRIDAGIIWLDIEPPFQTTPLTTRREEGR